MFRNEFRTHKTSKFGFFVNESSQSNFNLRLPGSYLVRSYLITTVHVNITFQKKFYKYVNGMIRIILSFFIKKIK